MKNIKDGHKEFGCDKHGIDYRIACETCQEMYMHFSDKLRELAENTSWLFMNTEPYTFKKSMFGKGNIGR